MWRRAATGGALMAMLLCSGQAFAEDVTVSKKAPTVSDREWRRNALALEPLSALDGSVRGVYERALLPRLSAVLVTQFTVAGTANESTQQSGESEGLSTSQFGMGVGPGIQYFFTGTAPEGLWAGLRLDLIYELKSFSQQLEGAGLPPGGVEARSFGNAFSYGSTLSAGYTATFGGGFLVQLGGEFGIKRQTRPAATITSQATEELSVVPTELTITEFELRPRVGIGYAF